MLTSSTRAPAPGESERRAEVASSIRITGRVYGTPAAARRHWAQAGCGIRALRAACPTWGARRLDRAGARTPRGHRGRASRWTPALLAGTVHPWWLLQWCCGAKSPTLHRHGKRAARRPGLRPWQRNVQMSVDVKVGRPLKGCARRGALQRSAPRLGFECRSPTVISLRCPTPVCRELCAGHPPRLVGC